MSERAPLTITEAAKRKVLEFIRQEERPDMALRIAIVSRAGGQFRYEFGLVPPEDAAETDTVIDAGEFRVFIDEASAPDLEGATFEWVENVDGAGFTVENPNSVWKDPRAQAVQKVIDEQINPNIAAHGGFVSLVGVEGDRAIIQMGGGCHGCGMADVTLRQGIEVMIKEAVPEIREIVDATDHASGTNPYYASTPGS